MGPDRREWFRLRLRNFPRGSGVSPVHALFVPHFSKTKKQKRPPTRKTRLDQTEVPIHSVTPPRKLFLSPSPHPISVAPLEQPEGAFVFCCIRARDKAHLPASRRVK